MALDAGTVYYSVDVDTSRLIKEAKNIDYHFTRMEKSTDANTDSVKRYGDEAAKAGAKSAKSTDAAARSAKTLGTVLTPLAQAMAGLFAIDTLRRAQALAEETSLLSARVRRLSSGAGEASSNFRQLMTIASETGNALPDTVALWENLVAQAGELGRTNGQIMKLVGTLQKMGAVGGASQTEMANSLRQFGQAMASGTVRAEEFASILENTPEITRQIAKGLGISLGELRMRMLDGKLTAQDVLGAIESQAEEVNTEFAKLPRTVSQAGNALRTSLGGALAELDSQIGTSRNLAWLMDTIATGIRVSSGTLDDDAEFNRLIGERARLLAEIDKVSGEDAFSQWKAGSLSADLAKVNSEIERLQQLRVQMIKDEAANEGGGQSAGTPGAGADSDASKLMADLKARIELQKQEGLQREILAAQQRAGVNATDEEKKAIADLVTELETLKQQEKDRLAAAEESRKAAEKEKEAYASNSQAVAELRGELFALAQPARDVAIAAAEASLNEYATPEQIETVRLLAGQLYDAKKHASDLAALGSDVRSFVIGDVSPLSGGGFDDQLARYDAELAAEEARYIAQQERLKEALRLEAEIEGGHLKLKEEMYAQHQARVAQIEKAKRDMMVSNAQSAFSQMASDLQTYMNTFGAENRALFNTMKAAAIASTIIQTYQGAQQAFTALSGIPYVGPALGAAAAGVAIAGGMARVAAIRAQTPGGRQYGGPVSPSSMYRINENGAPEVFNAANGQQFMLPNTRGEVVSNKDAEGEGGSGMVTVVVNINQSEAKAGQVEESQSESEKVIDIFVADITGDGRSAGVIQKKWGLTPAGR